MEKWNYGRTPGHYEVNELYHITVVVFPELHDQCRATPQPEAKVTLHNAQDGTSVTVPISMSSMSLLPSPQQRALEQEIQGLRAKLLVAEQTGWKAHSDKQAAEIKRLEQVCYSHAEGKQDAERKWMETVGELDNTKNQLKEVRVANGKLLEAKNQAESQVTRFATRNSDLEQECASLSKNKNSLLLTVQELRGKVQELNFAGAAKERDEYSKSLNVLKIKFEQATKQAGEWKQTALTRAKEMERLADLVVERTKERDALQAEKGLCPCKPKNQAYWVPESYTTTGAMVYWDPKFVASLEPKKQTVAETLSLNARVSAIEARVTKLEEADGFPMESYNVPPFKPAMLYMGGEWLRGVRDLGRQWYWSSGIDAKDSEWDKANQPTRWKPMPKMPK